MPEVNFRRSPPLLQFRNIESALLVLWQSVKGVNISQSLFIDEHRKQRPRSQDVERVSGESTLPRFLPYPAMHLFVVKIERYEWLRLRLAIFLPTLPVLFVYHILNSKRSSGFLLQFSRCANHSEKSQSILAFQEQRIYEIRVQRGSLSAFIPMSLAAVMVRFKNISFVRVFSCHRTKTSHPEHER